MSIVQTSHIGRALPPCICNPQRKHDLAHPAPSRNYYYSVPGRVMSKFAIKGIVVGSIQGRG